MEFSILSVKCLAYIHVQIIQILLRQVRQDLEIAMPSNFSPHSTDFPATFTTSSESYASTDMAQTTSMIPRLLVPRKSWKTPKYCISSHSSPRVQTSSLKTLGGPYCPTQDRSNSYAAASPSSKPYPRPTSFHQTQKYRWPCPQQHRRFSATRELSRDHHFDTLKFVQRLKDEGFSEEQSKAMMLVLSDVIEESIQNLTRTMVLREGTSTSSAWSKYAA